MKKLVLLMCAVLVLYNCNAPKKIASNSSEDITKAEQDTLRIANDELEYEIIIIEPGFNTWLQSIAKPEGYYSQSYLENRNRIYVIEWNQRVLNPTRYNSNLYEMTIDYQPQINYGYEVNYKLYNYFIYFQRTYKQRLAGFIPRI